MGFGQYSPQGIQRKSKAEMLGAVADELRHKRAPLEVLTSRMIARNTVEYRLTDGALRVRLHSTDILMRDPEGNITLDTGGWNTMTTRGRINDALERHKPGFKVYTSNGRLRLASPSRTTCVFLQRCEISRAGAVKADVSTDTLRDLKKDIDGFMRKLRTYGVPKDGSGDPWVFADKATHKYDAGQVQEWLRDPDTDEPYVFQTFIVNALRYAGCNDGTIGYWLTQSWERGIDSTEICRRVRRYIRACLGLAA
jgi:hypothetical protein